MNIILTIIGVLIILVYCSPLYKSKLNLGNVFGITLGFIICSIGLLYSRFSILINFWIFRAIFLLFTIFVLLHYITFMIIVFNAIKSATDEETIIVLGCRVKGDVPSLALQKRCESAYKYLCQNKNAVAIVSGGQGKDENISEAECMQKILIDKGIEKERIIIEDKSTSTYENLKFSKQIIESKNLSSKIAIVSSEYHIKRALMIAKKLGINAKGIPSKTIPIIRIPYFSREVFGIWWLIIKSR